MDKQALPSTSYQDGNKARPALLDKMLWLLTAWLLIFHLAVLTITPFLTCSTSCFQTSSKDWGKNMLKWTSSHLHPSPFQVSSNLFTFKFSFKIIRNHIACTTFISKSLFFNFYSADSIERQIHFLQKSTFLLISRGRGFGFLRKSRVPSPPPLLFPSHLPAQVLIS